MTAQREIADLTAAAHVKSQWGRALRYLLSAVIYGWAAATAQADLARLASPVVRLDLATATNILSLSHGPEGFYPLLGVIAAVGCTYLLRRRRIAQLEAASVADR
jgi:hypothetical protein